MDIHIEQEHLLEKYIQFSWNDFWWFIVTRTDDFIIGVAFVSLSVVILVLLWKRQSAEEKYRRRLSSCYEDLKILLQNTNSHPLLLRLAWSDANNYDQTIKQWPFCGGVNGSIRFTSELEEQSNIGLSSAIELLSPLKIKHSHVSWTDLIQMAGALAVEDCGGPQIDLWYGRVDVPVDLHELTDAELEPYLKKWAGGKLLPINAVDIKNRMLPQVFPPYPIGDHYPFNHLRILAARLGFSAEEMVALCGAHTIGRAFKERSGVCPFSIGDQGATRYTKLSSLAKGEKEAEVGISGGCSWTTNWLQFDNSYFKRPADDPHNPELLWLPTDQALFDFPEYRYHALKFANDQSLFFAVYSQAHVKMSELGAKFRFRIQLRRPEVVPNSNSTENHNN